MKLIKDVFIVFNCVLFDLDKSLKRVISFSLTQRKATQNCLKDGLDISAGNCQTITPRTSQKNRIRNIKSRRKHQKIQNYT